MSQTAAKHQPIKKKAEVSLPMQIFGVIGEILITIGILIGLFIVWQLWWTGIEANQTRAVAVAEFGTAPETEKVATPQEGPPPEWTGPTETPEVMGLIKIPRFGADYVFPIRAGTQNIGVLNTGSYGWYQMSQKPGELGNFALAAHRMTYGDPLIDVEELQNGDQIVIETEEAFLVYKITDHKIVMPEDGWVILPDPFEAEKAHLQGKAYEQGEINTRYITLTTCHPKYGSSHRWIVHGEFEYWTKRSDGIPPALAGQQG
ncbi:MAG: class E sortase [Trueperella sp.]|nr:class E sortase [Trueperella sp.]